MEYNGTRASAEANRYRRSASLAVHALLLLVATALTGWHYVWVDRFHEAEQRRWYVDILNGTCPPPHQFRPLPYFVTRALEPLTGDWRSASFLYRWLFSYGFLWATYQFGLLFVAPRRALLV